MSRPELQRGRAGESRADADSAAGWRRRRPGRHVPSREGKSRGSRSSARRRDRVRLVPGQHTRAPRRRVGQDQRGAGTVVTATIALLVCAAMLVAAVAAGWIDCVRHARAAADLAALSGASASLSGADGCRMARQVAEANAGQATDCRVDQAEGQVVLHLTVRVRLVPSVRGGPRFAEASSVAGRTAG